MIENTFTQKIKNIRAMNKANVGDTIEVTRIWFAGYGHRVNKESAGEFTVAEKDGSKYLANENGEVFLIPEDMKSPCNQYELTLKKGANK